VQSQIYVPAPRSPSLTAAPGIDAYIHAQTGGHGCGERAFLSEMGDPDLMEGGVTIDQVELRAQYGPYPSVR